jgi:hypothetical protein
MDPYYKLGGLYIKKPSEIKFGRYNLTKSGRVASGDMRLDIKTTKRKFELLYAVLSGTQYDHLENLLFGGSNFFTFEYVQGDQIKTATVYSGALNGTPFRTDGIWYYKDISFALIEQ